LVNDYIALKTRVAMWLKILFIPLQPECIFKIKRLQCFTSHKLV